MPGFVFDGLLPMTWLVFVVSVILTVAGGMSLVEGAPIIQIERGWAEVIAGTVAISGGVLTFAIGVVLLRLKSIHRALISGAASAAPQVVLPEVIPATGLGDMALRSTISEPAIETATPNPASEPEPAKVEPDADVRHGLWKRIRSGSADDGGPRDLDEHAAPVGTVGPADLFPVIPVVQPEPALPQISVAERNLRASDVSIAHPIPAPEPSALPGEGTSAVPAVISPVAVDKPAEHDGSIEWLDRGLIGRSDRPSFLDAKVTPTPRHAEPGADKNDGVSAASATGNPPVGSDATIIGRYQAGVASYVMYSDGTIEVEAEGGALRRFNSMEELKAFIARQEAAVG